MLSGLGGSASGQYHRAAGWSSPVARWAHNPEVTGSNPVPATKKTHAGPRGVRRVRTPFPSPRVRTNSNTGPHGEDASSFVDIANEQIRDHPTRS